MAVGTAVSIWRNPLLQQATALEDGRATLIVE